MRIQWLNFKIMDFKFHNGDKVWKVKGYKFQGFVLTSCVTTGGEKRVIVELITEPRGGNGDSMLHVFSENQLELV